MLEIVNVPAEARKGDAYLATSMKKGTFVVMSGTFSAADIAALPAGQKNKPGYAYAGDKKLVKAYAGDTGRCFPVDKKIFVPEDADSSSETIDAGAGVIYYTEGEFRTTEFTDVTSPVFGEYLKLSTSGTLTDEASPFTETGASVARVIKLESTSGDASDHRLHFVLL